VRTARNRRRIGRRREPQARLLHRHRQILIAIELGAHPIGSPQRTNRVVAHAYDSFERKSVAPRIMTHGPARLLH
jgi:hypothetical protein